MVLATSTPSEGPLSRPFIYDANTMNMLLSSAWSSPTSKLGLTQSPEKPSSHAQEAGKSCSLNYSFLLHCILNNKVKKAHSYSRGDKCWPPGSSPTVRGRRVVASVGVVAELKDACVYRRLGRS
ncbi:hypothetical protein HPP92_018552 [Vanilla planifolia]|uniref:Uncharacterized protein n=1 Tax=Vanilla planifolia TaxID=51239 RepID=A0A835UN02_VANPL|nr:hypothetical protein HPP92_019164 [Vanilla planifolia]KAG0469224.1 hypothetical protein HPP92_018552 [Vanilla planifolia]